MLDNIYTLIFATTLLVLVPGPNVALIVATSLQYGRKQGYFTVAGTTLGVALQLVLVVLGYTALVARAAAALLWIKWLGVICLLWLGLRAWRNAASVQQKRAIVRPRSFCRGALLAILNPKTLLFNAAFLPQFVPDAANAARELPLLAALYLLVIGCGDTLWVVFAGAAGNWLRQHDVLRRRLAGTLLMGAGATLALTREYP